MKKQTLEPSEKKGRARDRLQRLLQKAVDAEIGSPVEIVETRRDPKVTTTYAVRSKSDGCFLVQVFQGESEVIDTFELEEDQPTLRSLKVGEPSFGQF